MGFLQISVDYEANRRFGRIETPPGHFVHFARESGTEGTASIYETVSAALGPCGYCSPSSAYVFLKRFPPAKGTNHPGKNAE